MGKLASALRASVGQRFHRDRGASLAEFAIVLPLLIIIMFGVVEFGIAFNRAQAVEAAAREGARLASLQSTSQADITARVNDALDGIPITPDPAGRRSWSLCRSNGPAGRSCRHGGS